MRRKAAAMKMTNIERDRMVKSWVPRRRRLWKLSSRLEKRERMRVAFIDRISQGLIQGIGSTC